MVIFKDYPIYYKIRACGWIQDASNFENLHRFVSMFYSDSYYREELITKINMYVISEKKSQFLSILLNTKIEIDYKTIVGSAPKGSRITETVCDGLGQVALKGQKRDFLGDWPTDNFLRWAESLQFIEYNIETDKYSITKEGVNYASENKIEEQKKIIEKQLLMYAPAIRILSLLQNKSYTKFELGENLGFIGEKGFTYVTEELFVDMYFQSDEIERMKLKRDFEGSCDKYARQICSWLQKLNLVESIDKTFSRNDESVVFKAYKITPLGKNFLRKAKMTSKYIPFGMLSMEGKNKELHCKRRALIIKALKEDQMSINQIKEYLNNYQIESFEEQIKDDISSFEKIGLNIKKMGKCYEIKDKIVGLIIPKKIEITLDDEITKIKNELRDKLKNIDHDLLNIIDYSYSKRASRLFEVYIAKAYKKISKKTYLLGGPSKPDIITAINETTFIIDAKAYKNGFSLPISERDKMVRYIMEYKNKNSKWYNEINKENAAYDNFVYQFVSSGFDSRIVEKLQEIEKRTNVTGSALSAIALLKIIDKFLESRTINLEMLKSNCFPLQ